MPNDHRNLGQNVSAFFQSDIRDAANHLGLNLGNLPVGCCLVKPPADANMAPLDPGFILEAVARRQRQLWPLEYRLQQVEQDVLFIEGVYPTLRL